MIEFRFCQNCEKIAPRGTKCLICGGNIELKEPQFFIGKFFGKYKIEEILGQGGMGVVFLARHSILGRLSALKLIIPDLVNDADTFIERFLREAQLLAGLKHPNIIDVYDFDISEYGLPYYAMEYVEGISLRNLLAGDRNNLSLVDFGTVLKMCASALDYSHKKGIVHRDLKPENIIVSISENRPFPKILDFGIAKILSQESGKTLTGEGNIIGTLHYIAPEQILGGAITPKTDQYAFALIVAEIVSKRVMREGKTLGEICAADIQKPLGRECFPENTGEQVIAALQKATAKEPSERYATVSDFVSALEIKEPERADKLAVVIERKTNRILPTIVLESGKEVLSQLSSKKSRIVKSSANLSPSSQKRKPILLYAIIFSVVFLIVALSLIFILKKAKEKKIKNDYPLCQLAGEWQVPPDTSSILSSVEGKSAILKGVKSLYLVKFSSNQMPSMFPFQQTEELIGTTPEGEPVFLKNGKVIKTNLEENKETMIFEASKEKNELVSISRSCRIVAFGLDKRINIYSLIYEKVQFLSSLNLDTNVSEIKIKELSDKYFACIADEKVLVYEVDSAKQILNIPFSERVFSIFIDDVTENMAVWGWFDKIVVFSLQGGEKKEIRITGEPRDLLIIPDRPTIVVSGTFGIRFIDLNNSSILFEDNNNGKTFSSLLYTPRGVLALSQEKSSVSLYSLRTSFPEKVIKVGEKELWTITKDSRSETLFAGGIDGMVYKIDSLGEVSKKELHTLGVTALEVYKDYLISSSDDKSIAVFKISDLEVEYRSTAHKYLINYLSICGVPPKLWSSSSDGSLKSWSIPNLEELSSLSLNEKLKGKFTLHAFWISPDEKKMLIGTWNNQLIYIDRTESENEATIFKTPSHALLKMVELKRNNAILIIGGFENYGIYVFDLLTGNLFLLPQISPSAMIFSAASDKDEQTVYLCPFGSIMSLKVSRENDNTFAYEGSLFLIPEISSSSTMLSYIENNRIVVANSSGEVVYVGKDNLKSSYEFKGSIKNKIPSSKVLFR